MTDTKETNSLNTPAIECYGRGVLNGLAAFSFGNNFKAKFYFFIVLKFCFSLLVFSTSHFLQKPIKNRFNYSITTSLIISSVLASSITYKTTKYYLGKCAPIDEQKLNN